MSFAAPVHTDSGSESLHALADSADAHFALSDGHICSAAMFILQLDLHTHLCLRRQQRLASWTGFFLLRLASLSAIIILPLVRRGLFQLRQQTPAERRCVSTQRNARLTGSAFRNH